jgi:ubiquinone/menaquinone biosynthesis C-methylase UbiE
MQAARGEEGAASLRVTRAARRTRWGASLVCVYERIGEGYDASAGRYEDAARRNAEGSERLVRALPEMRVATVLDVGCGTGFAALRAVERFGARRVIGVDLSSEMIARFRRKLEALSGVEHDLRVADIAEVDLPAGTCDLALCAMALHWMADRAGAVGAMSRALAPGGVAALLAPGPGHDQEYVDLLRAMDPPVPAAIHEAFPKAAISIADLEGYLVDAGLEPLDIWVESRVRRTSAEAYVARMTAVGTHVWSSLMGPEETERTFARIERAVAAAAGPSGFEYTFTKTYAIARTPDRPR